MTRTKLSVLFFICLFVIPVSLFSQAGNAWPLPDYYHNLNKIWHEIRDLDSKYPDLIHWEILGTTDHDHLPIYAVKLSVNAEVQRDSIPAVLFVGQHHGEEIIGVEIVMNEMNQLLSNFGKDPFITSILENNEVWFVPTVNPEGYNFVSRSYYPTRRKNNTDTNWNGLLDLFEGGDGVDLNKSYDFNWENDAGTDPEEYYYKGPTSASEAETVAMQNFFKRERFQYAIMYHSSITGNFGEHIYFPWNWSGQKSPDYNDMKEIALDFAKKLPRDYRQGNYIVHTGSTSPIGFARDYIYANYGTYSYDVECGGINKDGNSIVRPIKPMYDVIIDKHYNAFLEFFKEIQDDTFRGRLLDKEGNPVADASIIYPTRHSIYQRAIKTNASGYFFKYLIANDLPFQVNLKYDFTTKQALRKADYTLPLIPEPVFAERNNEGLLYQTAPDNYTFPKIQNSKISTKLEMNLFDDLHWITSKSEFVNKSSMTWDIPELTRISHGEIKSYLFDKWRITNQTSQEILIAYVSQRSLSWCREVSQINGYWLHPNMAIGVSYKFSENNYKPIRLKGIKLFGQADGTLLHLIVSDDRGNSILDKEFYALGSENTILYSFPPLDMPKSTFISLENLSSIPWELMTETSLYPCSHENYVRYDEWQKTDTRDFGIELITEN
jgi:hypothetical protein